MRKIAPSEQIWILLAALLPVFALLVPRASGPAVFVLLALQLPRMREAAPFARRDLRFFFGLLMALVIWECVGLLWAQHGLRLMRPMAMSALFYAAAILLCLMPPSLSRDAHNLLARTLAGGWIMLILLVVLDMATGGVLFRVLVAPLTDNEGLWLPRWLNRAMTYAALLLWPVAAAYGVKRILLVAIFCFAHMALATWIGHVTALLATVFGAIAFFLVRRFGAAAVRILGLAIIALFLLMPVASIGPLAPDLYKEWLPELLPSAWHRLLIWEHASNIIASHPLGGLGLDSFRYLPSAKADLRGWQDNELIVLHPHNGMLQVWLELGLPGVLLFGSAILVIFQSISRMNRQTAAAATGLAISVLVFANLSFGMWQSWWQGLVTLAAASLMAIVAPRLNNASAG